MSRFIRYIILKVRCSRFLSRVIFQIDFEPVGKNDYYFDITTPVLVQRALKILKGDSRVLDMGTGAACVVGLSLWKKLGCGVTASDINPELTASARRNIEHNRAPIKVIDTRFFDGIDRDFDMVIFNPPYVPAETGKVRGLSSARRSQWDGGADGAGIIKDFLNAFEKFNRAPAALLGINRRHVPRKKMTELLGKQKEVSLEEIYSHPALPVDIYTLRRVRANR